MAEKDTASYQPRRGNERQGRAPYQQLAAEIAPYLAEQQFPGASNEAGNGIEVQNENETASGSGARESQSENNNRRRHYQELAADVAQPLADVHVTGGNNDATDGAASGEGRTENRKVLVSFRELWTL